MSQQVNPLLELQVLSCVLISVAWTRPVLVLSVLSGASAGTGSSGAAAGQTGPEGGVDPQWHHGEPEGDPAESTVQPHPDPAALHQTAPKPGEKHFQPTNVLIEEAQKPDRNQQSRETKTRYINQVRTFFLLRRFLKNSSDTKSQTLRPVRYIRNWVPKSLKRSGTKLETSLNHPVFKRFRKQI